MKLAVILEATILSFKLPTAAEIQAAKAKFRDEVKQAKFIYHVTSDRGAAKIARTGLKAGSYLSFMDVAWEGDVRLVMKGADVYQDIYPDPEQLIDSDKIHELVKLSDGALWSFKTVTKQIDKDLLFWLYYDLCEQEDWPNKLMHGAWLITASAIPAALIDEE